MVYIFSASICFSITHVTGRTWLDNVDCSNADRFEDCRHSGWGVENCGYTEDIGLFCDPGPVGNDSL